MAENPALRIGVDAQGDGVAGPHMVELGFLEIGRHPDFVGNEHGEIGPRLGIFAGRGGEIHHPPRFGRRHIGI